MKRGDAFKSKFLKASDLAEEDLTLTIRNTTLEKMPDDKEKPVVWFRERHIDGKGLVLNATNWDIIAGMLGDDSDDWSGKKITLTVEEVRFQGKLVPSIRVVEQRPTRSTGTVVNAGGATSSDDDDSLPF